MKDPIIAEVSIAAATTEVWRALRDPQQIRRWHGWEYDGLDAEIDAIYIDDVNASDDALTFDTGAGRFELERDGTTTTVRIRRAAPDGTASWDGVYDEINEGWLTFVQQLRYYLERHPGEERRTFMVRERMVPPAGPTWFASRHQEAVELDARTLVVVTPDRTIVSTYGSDAATLERLTATFGDRATP